MIVVLPRCVRKLCHYVDKIEEVVGVGDIRDAASGGFLIDELNGVLDDISYGGGVESGLSGL
ncbi:hypothetical protein KOY48_03025 [Candidatus Minimicrobia naudis]|uniref:Uncharacterized protein n=1 Tax=Candidatus Minimicrobia naudis TaxID=2841263 RepID=A0A8F1MBA2_9BACT|nr:hypothetical protein KOY48_03025 [Candidatus Minimicrobia naudis]